MARTILGWPQIGGCVQLASGKLTVHFQGAPNNKQRHCSSLNIVPNVNHNASESSSSTISMDMNIYGYPRISMDIHGCSWISTSWAPMMHHGNSWCIKSAYDASASWVLKCHACYQQIHFSDSSPDSPDSPVRVPSPLFGISIPHMLAFRMTWVRHKLPQADVYVMLKPVCFLQ